MKFIQTQNRQEGEADYLFDCPACGCSHGVWVTPHDNGNGATWQWNGDVNEPTLFPSLLVKWCKYDREENGEIIESSVKEIVCHSFISAGFILYQNDCTHEMAGEVVELPKI